MVGLKSHKKGIIQSVPNGVVGILPDSISNIELRGRRSILEKFKHSLKPYSVGMQVNVILSQSELTIHD